MRKKLTLFCPGQTVRRPAEIHLLRRSSIRDRSSVRLPVHTRRHQSFSNPNCCSHYGHLLASTIKDIIPRYWSMKGYHVERRFGWDTHGLPIEHEIDKKFKISGKQAVMEMGLDKYNAECRSIVMRYSSEWRETIERLGRWIDFDNDYKVGGETAFCLTNTYPYTRTKREG